jgi:hypothetical protein
MKYILPCFGPLGNTYIGINKSRFVPVCKVTIPKPILVLCKNETKREHLETDMNIEQYFMCIYVLTVELGSAKLSEFGSHIVYITQIKII